MNKISKQYVIKYRSILTLMFLMLVSSVSFAYDFTYKDSFVCGPKKFELLEGYKNLGIGRWRYFFFNLSEDDNFIVLHDDIQWPSFYELRLFNIKEQKGGVFTATHTQSNGIDIYKLIDKGDNPIFITTIMVDMKSMTYVARNTKGNKRYKPSMGICFK